MTKTTAQANSMIKIAALVVGGIYAYRRLTEGTAKELKASTTITPLGRFVVAWGVVFLTLSILAGPTPTLAGNMALLVMLASILANGVQISKDLQTGLKGPLEEQGKGSKAHPHPGVQQSSPIETRKA